MKKHVCKELNLCFSLVYIHALFVSTFIMHTIFISIEDIHFEKKNMILEYSL